MNAPDKATEIKGAIALVIAFFTSLWGWLGWAILAFLVALALDYITGSWAARANGEWSSTVARQGLWHKLGEIVALAVAALCDIAIRVILSTAAAPLVGDVAYRGYITLIVSVWYIFTELGSILENAARLGAPIPEKLIKGIGRLKNRTDKVELVQGDPEYPEEEKPHG